MNFYIIIDLKIYGKFAIKFDYNLGDNIDYIIQMQYLFIFSVKNNHTSNLLAIIHVKFLCYDLRITIIIFKNLVNY